MMDFDFDNSPMMLSVKLAKSLGFGDDARADVDLFPWLTIPEGFQIKPAFPYNGAAMRFYIQKKGVDARISVYFDTKDVLGFVGQPYYEAYEIDGDCARFLVGEEQEMMDAIVKELNERTK